RVTEKGTRQGSHPVRYKVKAKDGSSEIKTRPLNQYTVVADPRANKTQIRQAVHELFKVKVLRGHTLNVSGARRRARIYQAGRPPDWKKAIVKLKQGDKIVLT